LTTMEAIVNQDCEYNMCILDCPKVTMIWILWIKALRLELSYAMTFRWLMG
jgi:hypothetical protein